jgi:hypothetical protein
MRGYPVVGVRSYLPPSTPTDFTISLQRTQMKSGVYGKQDKPGFLRFSGLLAMIFLINSRLAVKPLGIDDDLAT